MSIGSSKIKKDIRSITFVSDKKTIITHKVNFTPDQHNKAIVEELPLKSTMERHDDFERAMSKFKVHLMVRCDFMDPTNRLNLPIDAPYFTDHIFEDDPRLKGVEVTAVIFTTKTDTTSFQIVGSKTTPDGEIIALKSPVISTIKLPEAPGNYNYPLLVFADEHKETLLLEAQEFLKYKSNAMTLFSSATVTKLTPKQSQAAEAPKEEKPATKKAKAS